MASAEISRVYLDYNATAPLRPEARAATLEALDVLGNPSSIHAEGRRARAIVEEARRAVAALAGVEPRGVVFVSGGTEAANLALTPAIPAPGREGPLTRLILSAGEHPCVLRGHRFAPEAIAIAPLKPDGRLDLEALAELLARGEGASMLALQGANNETGVLQPVAEAAALVHAAGGIVVCDAVQLPGRIDLAAATFGRRCPLPLGPQVRRPQGRGGADRDAFRPFDRGAAAARRRAGARRARRHRERRGDRRLRRRGARSPPPKPDARRRGSPPCGTGWRNGCAKRRRRRWSSARRRRACPTRSLSPRPASPPRRC